MSNLPYRDGMSRRKIGRDNRAELALYDYDGMLAPGITGGAFALVGWIAGMFIVLFGGVHEDLAMAMMLGGLLVGSIGGATIGAVVGQSWHYWCRRTGRILKLPRVVIEVYDELLEGSGVNKQTARAALVEHFDDLQRLLMVQGDNIAVMGDATEKGKRAVRDRIADCLRPIAKTATETHQAALAAAKEEAEVVTAGIEATLAIDPPA